MRMPLLHSLLFLALWLPHSSTAFANTKPWGLLLGRSSSARSATVVSDDNLALLSERGRKVIQALQDFPGQVHVLADWPAPGTEDEGKRRLTEQLSDLDDSYPGGLPAYLSKAETLLAESAAGTNPFDAFEAVVPDGEILTYCNDDDAAYADVEELGLAAADGLIFCLVAGGLGERLGYSGIKLSLETNVCTETCYLELYCQFLLAVQQQVRERTGNAALELPLVIMTSGDTDQATRDLLQAQANFGLSDDQLCIVTQDKVAALQDGAAGLALKDNDRWTVQTKPHGHGDVHHLLLREGLVDRWEKEGRTHVVFLQDTNGLVINSILPALGVSVRNGFQMNSICIPRIAGEAAGAITRLEHKTDPRKSLVINVEYNQLDPLLKTQGEGDVPDPATGYSPFPGNANNLVIELGAYAKTLRGEDQGVVLEFVNPKYNADGTFKKPTRLECMMQDIPKLFQKELADDCNIGFTTFDRWCTFSPAKNALDAGQDAVAGGNTAPGTLSSAESDLYVQNQLKLQEAGADVPVMPLEEFPLVAGIPITPGPRVVLSPSFGTTKKELDSKLSGKGDVRISQNSSLVVDGRHVELKKLQLDGALVLRVETEEASVVVDGLSVTNKGWSLQELDSNKEYDEATRIRGYTLERQETKEYVISQPGQYRIDESGELTKQ